MPFCVHQASGTVYYWHIHSGEVTWEKPKELVSKSPQALPAEDPSSVEVCFMKFILMALDSRPYVTE
jgi:hypothetical protein